MGDEALSDRPAFKENDQVIAQRCLNLSLSLRLFVAELMMTT